MDKLANFSPKFWRFFGYSGIVVGYLGLLFITYLLVDGLLKLLLIPEAPATIAPVIPGVKIPGSPLFIPFWSGIISIFIVAYVHEFAHGIMARVYGMKVKSSGIAFFGPIIGAFVEPDEEELKKSSKMQQLSVFAAGPFSNICLGILVLLIIGFVLTPLALATVNPSGVEITEVQQDFPAQISGLEGGEVIKKADNISIESLTEFTDYVSEKKPGELITLSTDENGYVLNLTSNPENASKAYMGVSLSQDFDIKPEIKTRFGVLPWAIFYLISFFRILFILTLGIGFANLLPLGPVDGGRILQVTLYKWFDKAKANMIWKKISLATFFILLFNLLFPFIRSVLF
jgi:membrane-associated protease RseP (regulator of RpoE activity)